MRRNREKVVTLLPLPDRSAGLPVARGCLGCSGHVKLSHAKMMMNTSENLVPREREIRRVTLVGSVGNLMLTLFKFFAGIMGHSAAMVADAVHSLSDLATDVVVILFVRLAGRPSDRDHAFGHGKYETLATAVIGLLLLAVGCMIFWNGATAVYAVCRGEQLPVPGHVALVAALVSVATKELLYQYTARRGRKLHSQTMVANAWHHRSDALSSVGTALGIGGAVVLGPRWAVLDPLAAIVVSALIVHVAYKLLLPCVGELLEQSLPEAEEQYIRQVILSHPGVSDPHNLRTRRIGDYRAIEVHFRMDGNTTIHEAHAATRAIEDALREKFGRQTIINTHVEPVK